MPSADEIAAKAKTQHERLQAEAAAKLASFATWKESSDQEYHDWLAEQDRRYRDLKNGGE